MDTAFLSRETAKEGLNLASNQAQLVRVVSKSVLLLVRTNN